MSGLQWPDERARRDDMPAFSQSASNVCLDFHGDPARAGLVVYSDGNHHMALGECLERFLAANPALGDVFYATTPPRVIVQALRAGRLRVGNLEISTRPHLFISPPQVLAPLVQEGVLQSPVPLARGRGSVLLVRAGNPKSVRDVKDLARDDVMLFISNPDTEKASYDAYAQTLRRLARRAGVSLGFLDGDRGAVVYGEAIHHREAPQAVADGRADVAVVFSHLALRYTRIFPGRFEIVLLAAQGDPDNLCAETHAALVGDGGRWGRAALDFLTGPAGAAIYERHGLEAPPRDEASKPGIR
jgi:hypothetical protein